MGLANLPVLVDAQKTVFYPECKQSHSIQRSRQSTRGCVTTAVLRGVSDLALCSQAGGVAGAAASLDTRRVAPWNLSIGRSNRGAKKLGSPSEAKICSGHTIDYR